MSVTEEHADLPETKEPDVFSRRGMLRAATILAGGATLVAASMSAAVAQGGSGKMSQQAAAYQTSPKNGQRCTDCSFYVAPGACKLVDGTISPAGWCKFFAKKS
jgi:hypothetical protein